MHRALPALVIAVALLTACGDDEYARTPGPGETRTAVPGKADIVARDFSFTPADLAGAMGVPLTVTLKNEGSDSHTFTIDELFVDQIVEPANKATFRVTPSAPGEFNFYCRFHVDNGMLGAIVVAATGQGAGPEASLVPSGSPGDTSH